MPRGARGQRGLHLTDADQPRLAQGRALGDQRLGAGEDGALAGPVVGFAVRLLHQARHGGGRKVRQRQPAAGLRHEDAGGAARGLGGDEAVGKVHLHPEVPRKLGVALLQLVEMLDRADQHDLHVHIHRLRLQRHRAHRRAHRARLLDLQPGVAQEAAQLLPDQRVGHQVAQMQHQEAAVRLEQAAGADAREVGHQHVVLGLVFDAAEQGAELRVVLDDHRRAAQALVVHHQVHAVARQRGLQRLAPAFIVGFEHLEQLDVFQHVALDLVQPGAELDRILDLFLQSDPDGLQLVLQHRTHHLAAQLGAGLVHDPLHGAGLLQEAVDLAMQLVLGPVELGAALARQFGRLLFGQRLAVLAAQGEHQVPVLAAQGKVALLGKTGQLGIGHGLLREVGLLDLFAAGLEFLPLQPLRHLDLQRLDQRGHELAQLAPLPGGHSQGARALGRVEVVQVAQVRRHGPAGRHGLHQLLQQRGAPAADLAQHKQVVAGLLQGEPKASRGFGPLLADPGQGVAQQLGGVDKAELRGVEGEPQLAGGQAGYRHGRSGGRVQGALVQA
ncbi:MAG: hypothetical protein BWX79_02624 [Alphaproteobacteria bacterium ADurb.Bin100]|nr:MAG: hypothetical protein BWX79_02624 [Alphaproteobacteria bacterium ADurb.Bin100]